MFGWLEKKYINIIGSRYRNFKWKKSNLANCSCPKCGDSKKNKTKARFYFVEDKAKYRCFCHNCNYTNTFNKFLQEEDYNLWCEYRTELYKEKSKDSEELIEEVEYPEINVSVFNNLLRCDNLEIFSKPWYYLKNRKIPEDTWHRIYYTDNFKVWANTLIPDKFKHPGKKDPRIIFPFTYKENLFGCSARTIDYTEKVRYYTLSIDYKKEYPHLFGLDYLDFSKQIYCVEGPIDSLFIPNCIAMSTSSIQLENNIIDFQNVIFVLDNEPRNKEINDVYKKYIEKGCQIVIWPNWLKEKDINEMVLNNIDYMDIISRNKFNGLKAKLMFSQWSKI